MSSRLKYYFRERVTEDELNQGFDLLEHADRNLAADLGFVGVIANAQVSQHAPVADLTVDVSGPGITFDQQGQRILFFSSVQTVNCAQDENGVSTSVSQAGKEKLISIFVKSDRALSDPRIDGNSLTVFFHQDESFKFLVAQGAEANAGAALPPPLRSDAILLADVRRAYGQAQILNGDVSTARRQDAIRLDSALHLIRRGRIIEAMGDLLAVYNEHVAGTGDCHPASAITGAPGPNWADGSVNPAADVGTQLKKLLSDLAGQVGAAKIGASGTSGSPLSLAAGSVRVQLDALLTAINNHVNGNGHHQLANSVDCPALSNWADGSANPAATVQAVLTKIISDLAGTSGSALIGAAQASGSPVSLTAGSITSQLLILLGAINDHLNKLAGAHAASAISTVPAGNVASTTVQGALNELDAEKAGLALANTFTATQTIQAALLVGQGITATNASPQGGDGVSGTGSTAGGAGVRGKAGTKGNNGVLGEGSGNGAGVIGLGEKGNGEDGVGVTGTGGSHADTQMTIGGHGVRGYGGGSTNVSPGGVPQGNGYGGAGVAGLGGMGGGLGGYGGFFVGGAKNGSGLFAAPNSTPEDGSFAVDAMGLIRCSVPVRPNTDVANAIAANTVCKAWAVFTVPAPDQTCSPINGYNISTILHAGMCLRLMFAHAMLDYGVWVSTTFGPYFAGPLNLNQSYFDLAIANPQIGQVYNLNDASNQGRPVYVLVFGTHF